MSFYRYFTVLFKMKCTSKSLSFHFVSCVYSLGQTVVYIWPWSCQGAKKDKLNYIVWRRLLRRLHLHQGTSCKRIYPSLQDLGKKKKRGGGGIKTCRWPKLTRTVFLCEPFLLCRLTFNIIGCKLLAKSVELRVESCREFLAVVG